MKASTRIKLGMRRNERWVLSMIREEGHYYPLLPGLRIHNALDRLCDRGVIRYSRRKGGYVMTQARKED